MTHRTMNHPAHRPLPIDPLLIAEAMLDRGFAQLLVPEALDDGPAGAPRLSETRRACEAYSECSNPDSAAPDASTKFSPAVDALTAWPIQLTRSGLSSSLSARSTRPRLA